MVFWLCRSGFAEDVVRYGIGVSCLLRVDTGTEVALVLLEVVVECSQQAFGVHGVHDDA